MEILVGYDEQNKEEFILTSTWGGGGRVGAISFLHFLRAPCDVLSNVLSSSTDILQAIVE